MGEKPMVEGSLAKKAAPGYRHRGGQGAPPEETTGSSLCPGQFRFHRPAELRHGSGAVLQHLHHLQGGVDLRRPLCRCV